jgi:protein kinase A
LKGALICKRYGNLKAGAADIVGHKWFSTISVEALKSLQINAPFKPNMKDENDVGNFEQIPDSAELPPIVTGSADPFSDW